MSPSWGADCSLPQLVTGSTNRFGVMNVVSRIPRKSSRPIVVDGRKFRWMLRGRSRYLGNSPPAVTITIQEDLENPGTVLQCDLISKNIEDTGMNDPWDDRCQIHKASIRPKDVESLIRAGLLEGWDPEVGRGVFRVSSIDLTDYKTNSF